MIDEVPECLILEGPNGGGESTVYRRLLAEGRLSGQMAYINTDDNAKNFGLSDIAAGRRSVLDLNGAIDNADLLGSRRHCQAIIRFDW